MPPRKETMRFHPNTVKKIAGIDGKLYVQELVFGQNDFLRLSLAAKSGQVLTPVVTATVQKKLVTSMTDSARGLDIEFTNDPTSVPIPLVVTTDTNGLTTILIDSTFYTHFSLEPLEVGLLTGTVKMEFAATTIEPAFTEFLFLAFVVRDDQVETV